jgi:hypothetical protein
VVEKVKQKAITEVEVFPPHPPQELEEVGF